MALQSYREALGSRNIGPGITVTRGGIFDEPGEASVITLDGMNRELEALSSFDPIIFEHDEPPPDHLLSVYLKEKAKQ